MHHLVATIVNRSLAGGFRADWRPWLFLALVSLAATPAAADPIVVPTGLGPSDQYRLAFLTSTTRDATSADLADYNSFVTGVANTVPALVALGTNWNVIGSTFVPNGGTDARTNTGTDPTVNGTGVPIFLLNDTKLVDDNDDLWDASIDVPFNINENGDAVAGGLRAWTGTQPTGISTTPDAGVNFTLDAGNTVTGEITQTGLTWSTNFAVASNQQHPMYALSDVLTVPEPGSFMLISIGAIGLIGYCSGRKRKKANAS
jgi:hypothetical protein